MIKYNKTSLRGEATMSIVCQVFGIPSIKKDGMEAAFPYKKVKAIFYYLLINNHCTRDELANIFWDELPDSVAKKNLRNALYQIKNILGDDILLSSEKSLVVLNTQIITYAKLDDLSDPETFIENYKGEFLQGFIVKDALIFEQWCMQQRQHYKDEYIKKIYICINEEKIKSIINWDTIINYARTLIVLDEFDENAYRILLFAYKNIKAYSQAIELYNKLKLTLEKELCIEPDNTTTAILNEVLDDMNDKRQNISFESMIFFGRHSQLRRLEQNHEFFMRDEPCQTIIICGEQGIGKSNLLNNLLNRIDKSKLAVWELECLKNQQTHDFSFFKNIIRTQLDDINIQGMWKRHLLNILELIKKPSHKALNQLESFIWDAVISVVNEHKTKILITVESIHYIDHKSAALLDYILANNKDIYMIGTAHEYEKSAISSYLSGESANRKLEFINLKRWDFNQVRLFVSEQLPKELLNERLFEEAYFETQGNPLFIKFYLEALRNHENPKQISEGISYYLDIQLQDLQPSAITVIELISFFFEDTNFDMMSNLSDIPEKNLIEIIQELIDKVIIKETIQNDMIRVSFIHPKMRQYIYERQSGIKRRFLHNQIGDVIEKQLDNKPADMDLYHRLIFHYMRGGNKIKALDYSVKSLNRYLNYSHELFPILASGDEALFKDAYMSRKQTLDYLEEIEDLLKEVRQKEGQSEAVIVGEIAFLHMKGRYLIREGNYEDGTKYIKEMINKAIDIQDDDYALEAYKQMIYYCIQVSEAGKMKEYIQLALDIAIRRNYHKETGIILRFKGLYHILLEEYALARELLTSSINTFTISKEVAEKYALNIAAAYNYIGEIYRLTDDYDQAIDSYEKAIEIGKSKNAYTSLMVFYINAGQTMYHKEDYDKAMEYLDLAKGCQSMVDILWKKAILDAYLGLIHIRGKKKSQGLKMIKTAEVEAKKMKNPDEIKIVAWAKEEAFYIINAEDI